MDWFIYASIIAVALIAIFFPSLRPQRLSFIPNSGMNVARCIELHNEIVRLGWQGMGRAPEDFQPETWFEHHGPEAEKHSRKLSKDLKAFLRGAYESSHQEHFHYYVSGLFYPSEDMFAFIDHTCGYVEKMVNMYDGYHRRLESRKLKRYVRLYYATNLVSHAEGLIFDQHSNTAIMCMSIHDGTGLCQPDRIKWYPLEEILAAWLDMIRVEKVKAVGYETEYRPWKLLPYSASQLDEAVQTFNKLVGAIEMRMPALETSQVPNTSLFNQDTLVAASIPPGFAFDFLSRIRHPRFRYIAPGLEILNQNTISNQPFFGMMNNIPEHHRDEYTTPPILLFRSSLEYKKPSGPDGRWNHDVFNWPFNASMYTAGLYFHDAYFSNNPHYDQVSLVLPYAIGVNGWARKSDGSLFGEQVSEFDPPRAHDVYSELYQMGHQPFIEQHAVRLVKVLRSWLVMVQNGDWTVGAEGISNGINEWKKADTRGGWKKYFIEPDW